MEYIAIKCRLILKLSQMKSLRALIKLVHYLPEHDSLMAFTRFYHIPFGGNYLFSILWKRVPPSKCLLVLMITSLCDISLEAEESLAISINRSILNESLMKKGKHWEFFFPREIMYLRSEFPFCPNCKIRHAVKLKKKIKINLFSEYFKNSFHNLFWPKLNDIIVSNTD